MPDLILVRHGQASFNTADYDRLSPLGTQQAQALARFWLSQEMAFDEVLTGTLARQQQTERAFARVYEEAGMTWPTPSQLQGLDEFPAEKVVRKLTPELCLRDRQVRRLYRRYARGGDDADEALMGLVMRVCEYWARGKVATPVSPSWPQFRQQVEDVLRALRQRATEGRRVLAVTSGGVISVAMQLVSGESLEEAIARNWDIPNASRTAFCNTPDTGGLHLTERAAVDHLEDALQTLR
ncbi:MAG: histidine phosphatase family protein [Pseudomonadota bacterium]